MSLFNRTNCGILFKDMICSQASGLCIFILRSWGIPGRGDEESASAGV